MKMTVMPSVIDTLGTIPKDLVKGLEDLRGQVDTIQTIVFKIGQKTERSPGDLRRFSVTLTPVKAYQVKKMRKSFKD